MTKVITNPRGAFGQTDAEANAYQVVVPFINDSSSVDISAGDVVVFSYDSTSGLPQVGQADVSADDLALVAGVALTDILASDNVPNDADGSGLVVIQGFALVNIDDATVAAGELGVFHATADGAADGVAADATTVTGDHFGVFLAGEIGTTNQAPIWLK